MNSWMESFLGLFYPSLCLTCNRTLFAAERYMCMFCIHDLPRTHFHMDPSNRVAQLFWGRVAVEYATSWLYFRKGSHYQQLIHHLKYKGLKELGHELGILFGNELVKSSLMEADLLMPVPLHAKKERQRGYNQSAWISTGLAAAMQKPVLSSNLIRSRFTPTQTRRNRFERWQNVEGIFEVMDPAPIQNRHILLIDDVITTGATLEAALHTLLASGAAKVSVAALAVADI